MFVSISLPAHRELTSPLSQLWLTLCALSPHLEFHEAQFLFQAQPGASEIIPII